MEKNKKSPEQELVESIGLMIDKGLESTTDVYTGVVKSVNGKRAIVSINGRNQNVAISSAAVASGNVVRVFVPRGNMSAAFIVKAESNGGGGTTTTAYGDLTGKPRINGVTLVDNKTSKELNLYGTGNAPPYPVTSVNGKTGDVTISAGGNVDSVNGKTGAVVLTQDDIGNGTTYVRTHNDFTDALKTQINTNEDNIAMAESDIDGLQTDVGTLKTNVGNIQTALTSKQDVVVGAASTITENNLTINRALVSNSSGKVAVSNVTSTELGYLDGVTSNVQTQLNNKLENIPIATSTTLGGVKPVAKTDDMTQQIGVDANGALYTAKENYIVHFSFDSSTQKWVADKTTAEIKAVRDAGDKFIYAVAGTLQPMPLWNISTDSNCYFGIFDDYGFSESYLSYTMFVLWDDGTVTMYSHDVLAKDDISNNLNTDKTSTTKVPSCKATYDAIPHPDTKTNAQTQSVGMDSDGKLWTVPGGGGTGSGDMLKSVYDPTGSVATAGGIPDYVDANGGKIDTIEVNGVAQVISDKKVNITVPTKTSDITNDSGYLTSAPVTSVNSKTGAVQLNANDVGALPNTTVIPSKTSQLNNDSGFITELPIASATQIGGVKIGAGLSVTENGTLSTTGGGGSSEAFVAVFGIHGENTYDKSLNHSTTTTYDNIVAAYNAKTPCYAKIRPIGTDYEGYVVAPLAYVDEVYGEVYFASTRMTKGNTPKELIVCYAAIDFEGNAEGYFGIQYTLSSTDKVLPPVTTADNGKFLRVVNGAWSAETIPSANGGSF